MVHFRSIGAKDERWAINLYLSTVLAKLSSALGRA